MLILVLGYLVRGPLGGLSWHHLQYVMGLAQLGHDVWFIEDSDDYESCYDPSTYSVGRDPSYGLAYANRVFRRVGLESRWAYHDAHLGRWHGPARGRVSDLARHADGPQPLVREPAEAVALRHSPAGPRRHRPGLHPAASSVR